MEEIDLKELFLIFWKRKIIIILVTVVLGIAGFVYTKFKVTPMYKSSINLLLVQNVESLEELSQRESITEEDLIINSKLVPTYSELVKSDRVLKPVIEKLGLNISKSALKSCISVSSVGNTDIIKITVQNVDGELAAKIANEVADVFIAEVKEIYKIDNVTIVDPAEVSGTPFNINYKKNSVIFALAGFIATCGIIFAISLFDTKIKNSKSIEDKYNLFVLANIPMHDESQKGGKR